MSNSFFFSISIIGTIFSESSASNYYQLDTTNDWNQATAQQYGGQHIVGASPQPPPPLPSSQQSYGINIHGQHPQAMDQVLLPSSNTSIYDTVASSANNNNNNSLSSLPPMSTFATNRSSEMMTTGAGYSATTTISSIQSPIQTIDIKPDITSLYPMTNNNDQQSTNQQQWPTQLATTTQPPTTRRSPPTPLQQQSFQSTDIKSNTNEINHLHTMVSFIIPLVPCMIVLFFVLFLFRLVSLHDILFLVQSHSKPLQTPMIFIIIIINTMIPPILLLYTL